MIEPRKQIYEKLHKYSVETQFYDFTSISKLIEDLQQLLRTVYTEQKDKNFIDIMVVTEGQYDDTYTMVYGVRLETDKEYENRLKQIENQKLTSEQRKAKKEEEKLAKEKALYLELKKKFGD